MPHRIYSFVAIPLLLVVTSAYGVMPDFVSLVKSQGPTVVSIRATGTSSASTGLIPGLPENSPFQEYFRRFFEQLPQQSPQRRIPSSIGSGFAISKDGYIITNAHVVKDMEDIIVGLSDRRELAATVVGLDERSDIALLRVKANNLPSVTIGNADQLEVGQWVLAIGSPFGFESTATQGIISALGRSLPRDTYVPFIQTDVAVNPGNSGGPLFNLKGEVIGVNSQIYSRTGGYQGVSFAIPIDVAMNVVEQIKKNGRVTRGWLGVAIQSVTSDLAKAFGLPRPYGALVGQVVPDSPAAKAGVQDGDIIIAVNGTTVEESSQLPPMIGKIAPGDQVKLTIVRKGKQQTVAVTVRELPGDKQLAAIGNGDNLLKVEVAEQKDNNGMLIASIGDGPAARAGLRKGDVILAVNNRPTRTMRQFMAATRQLPKGQPLPVLVQRRTDRGVMTSYVAVVIPKR